MTHTNILIPTDGSELAEKAAFVLDLSEGTGFSPPQDRLAALRHREDRYDNQFKGFSSARRRRGQSQKMADERRCRVPV